MSKENKIGLTVKKSNDFSEWFTQILQKADLTDYTEVSGCIVFKPRIWAVLEKIRDEVDTRIKPLGIKNVYFPMFIPEKFLTKEADHVKGFAPEVAWVTHAGNTKLSERLAVRPTSEAIMYPSFSNWTRSWRDLPIKLNQWSNVVRWEFKHATPLLRTREFLFNEGHTVFATEEEALAEQKQIIDMYTDICENYLAIPAHIGNKSEKEKFAGAVFTTSMEFYMPNGRSIQGPDFHHDGQNFAKAYEIKYLDQTEKEQYAWQNTWAISSRMLGVAVAVHSDDNGLVLPPKIASEQIVIVPILFDDTKKKVLAKAEEIKKKLDKQKLKVILDDRNEYSAGWKFNEWELKGVPIRIELGPKDIENGTAILVRRDTLKKESVKLEDIHKQVPKMLDDMQKSLFKKAKKMLEDNTLEVKNRKEFLEAVDNKKIVQAYWCAERKCEDLIKDETNGVKTLNSPFKQPSMKGKKCIYCGKDAKMYFLFGRSY